MNRMTTATATAAASIAAALAITVPASASTSGCERAPFTCGTFTGTYANGMQIARLGWSATAATAGSPIVMEPDRAGARSSDFALIHRDRDYRVEYAPYGIPSHLYVAANVIGAYRKDGRVVKANALVLAGWNGSWDERWTERKAGNEVELVNDYSGLIALVPSVAGAQVTVTSKGTPMVFIGNEEGN